MTNNKKRQAKPEKKARTRPTSNGQPVAQERRFPIADWRLENPDLRIGIVQRDGEVRYVVEGKLNAPVPPLRESKYLKHEQCVEIYRYMLLNRRMEQALENLYKQGKVVGGVYFGLGQEGCSCASAYALQPDDWFGPMIRNQGALLVRGWKARDVMMQYMAKAGSPSGGKDANTHFGDTVGRNQVAPVSMLGEHIPILTGVALGARLQGREIACLTWIGDGGQSTGVTYEGLNFAAVHGLGLVLIVENNLWAYSTPTELQSPIRDLAERAVAYGIPGVIVDGTDACQVYDATHEACERARRGDGPTLIEAKMMRMKGHAIHDAAGYVPKELFDFWQQRDPISRMENFLLGKGWITPQQNRELIAGVDRELESDREVAVNSPMPRPEEAARGVFCDEGCHRVAPKYGALKTKASTKPARLKQPEAAVHLK